MKKNNDDQVRLTPEEIEQFKALLLEKRSEILGNVVSMENDTLKRDRTDLSNMPLHLGDMGTDSFELDNALSLVGSERKLIEEIDEALDRVDSGTFGICLGSGQPISRARLTAIPWAKYSIEYASQMEKGSSGPEGYSYTYEEPEEDDYSDENAG